MAADKKKKEVTAWREKKLMEGLKSRNYLFPKETIEAIDKIAEEIKKSKSEAISYAVITIANKECGANIKVPKIDNLDEANDRIDELEDETKNTKELLNFLIKAFFPAIYDKKDITKVIDFMCKMKKPYKELKSEEVYTVIKEKYPKILISFEEYNVFLKAYKVKLSKKKEI